MKPDSPSRKVLILGKLPPPIGGVRIHVERLVDHLYKEQFPYFVFARLDTRQIPKILTDIFKSKVIHLHTSNTFLQLILSVCCWICNKKLIITYHSNWGRYNFVRNSAERFSAFFATIPLVQNPESLARAMKLNRKAILMPAFIPPIRISPLPVIIAKQLLLFREKFTNIFCTHAWNITFDKYGKETYGISDLISAFTKMEKSGLVISDPSGHYQEYIKKMKLEVPSNIFWISEPHDFINVLTLADAFIRNTTTDGTCISIYEALLNGIIVFATDVVSRPPGCRVYEMIKKIDLEDELVKIKESGDGAKCAEISDPDVVKQLIKLYQNLTDS